MSISDLEPARADFGRRILPRNTSVSTRITQHDSSFGTCASKAVQTAKTPINSGIERYPRREIHRLFHTSVKNFGRLSTTDSPIKENSIGMAGNSTGGSLIDDVKLKQLYATMLQCRLLMEHGRRIRRSK